ncbi:hypothetical protein ACVWZZ_004496 [Bradyrhizobium sp. LM6.10]
MSARSIGVGSTARTTRPGIETRFMIGCHALACGDQRTQPPGEEARGQAATVLSSQCQDSGNDSFTQRPCRAVQAASAAIAYPAQPARQDHPVIRDICRKIERQPNLEEAFAFPLGRASQIRSQPQRQRGSSASYQFGVKASIVAHNRRAPGRLFVLHAESLPQSVRRSRGPMSRRDTAAKTQKTPVASSSPARSAASSASSSAR